METCTDLPLSRALYGGSRNQICWKLVCKKDNNLDNVVSEIKFIDAQYITQKILADVFFRSRIKDVSKLDIKHIQFVFRYITDQGKEPKHNILIDGFGGHSIVEYDPSPFKVEYYSTPLINRMIHQLLMQATQDELK